MSSGTDLSCEWPAEPDHGHPTQSPSICFHYSIDKMSGTHSDTEDVLSLDTRFVQYALHDVLDTVGDIRGCRSLAGS